MFDRFARNRRDSIMYKEMLKQDYGRQLVRDKTAFATDFGMGGVMIWHFGTDSFDPELSLINVIDEVVGSGS